MTKDQAENLLAVASEQVPLGVYAVRKGNHLEMRRDRCESKSQVKAIRKAFKSQGYKVYANGI